MSNEATTPESKTYTTPAGTYTLKIHSDPTEKNLGTRRKRLPNDYKLKAADKRTDSLLFKDLQKSYGSYELTLNGAESPDTLYLFNVLIALEWIPSARYVELLRRAFRKASHYLYDITDGFMAFGQINIAGPDLLAEADIQILATNRLHPRAWLHGLFSNERQPIRLGRSVWNQRYRLSIPWDEPEGYRTIVHEWAHYALGFRDSYLEYIPDDDNTELVVPRQYPDSFTLMTSPTVASEFVHGDQQLKSLEKPYPKMHEILLEEAQEAKKQQVPGTQEGPGEVPIPLPHVVCVDEPHILDVGANDTTNQDTTVDLIFKHEYPLRLEHSWLYIRRGSNGSASQKLMALGTLQQKQYSSRHQERLPLLSGYFDRILSQLQTLPNILLLPAESSDLRSRLFSAGTATDLEFIASGVGIQKNDNVILIAEHTGDEYSSGTSESQLIIFSGTVSKKESVNQDSLDGNVYEQPEKNDSPDYTFEAELSTTPLPAVPMPVIGVVPIPVENKEKNKNAYRLQVRSSSRSKWWPQEYSLFRRDRPGAVRPDTLIEEPSLDGHVLVRWIDPYYGQDYYMVYPFSQGGGPNAHNGAGGDPPLISGSADGNVMIFFKTDKCIDLSTLKIITTRSHVSAPARTVLNDGQEVVLDRYAYAVASSESLQGDSVPTLVTYYRRDDSPVGDRWNYEPILCRLDTDGWKPLEVTHRSPTIWYVAVRLSEDTAPGLFKERPQVESYRLGWRKIC